MSIISYDGQSLTLGGRRVWLVGGLIDYARVPAAQWQDRILAAKHAGLNCVWTSCMWRLHEPAQGEMNFKDGLDLRRFVQMVGEYGMFCVPRVGPYIGDGLDSGGLPGWLQSNPAVRLREATPPYLEACGRYFSALLNQIKDLQVHQDSAPVAAEAAMMSGTVNVIDTPVVMVQAENQWTCGNPDAARAYLGEVFRYLREHGCTVPILESNHLWASTERAIAGWSGSEHLSADLRQLQQVQPEAPRFVAGYDTGNPQCFGEPTHEPVSADDLMHGLASVLAVGGQYCVAPLHGGSNFEFSGGTGLKPGSGPLTASNDRGAPLTEAGGRRESYLALKRISTFASRFGQLFAHLEPNQHHAAIAVDGGADQLSVLHQRGSQGHVVFLFNHERKKDTSTEILLPNGLTLPVPLGTDQVAWFITDVPLHGSSMLEYTNLRPWAWIARKLLVLFGPPGADGIVCIDGSALHVTVPTGHTPIVEVCEDVTVVVLNTNQVDAAIPTSDGVFVGAAGLDEDGEPLPLKGWTTCTVVTSTGQTRRRKTTPAERLPSAPKLTSWVIAAEESFVNGTDQGFEKIDGPASLESLNTPDGYGWYRIECGKNPKSKVMFPYGAGRLHVFRNGDPVSVVHDPYAPSNEPIDLHATGTLVVLAENPGRFSEGWHLDQPKGVFGHLYAASKISTGPLKTGRDRPPDLFSLRAFYPGARTGVQGATRFYTWSVKPIGSNPIYIQIHGLPARALLSVNDEPFGAYDPVQCAEYTCFILLPGDHLKRGNNTVRLSMLDTDEPAPDITRSELNQHVTVYQGTKNLTNRATWSFAPWGIPEEDAFGPMPSKLVARPSWFRGQFSVNSADVPLWFEPAGLSKGQLYLNDHNVGRYVMTESSNQPVPGQSRYYLPEAWLHTDTPNVLTIFDEQGNSPKDCTLVYDPMGPHGE